MDNQADDKDNKPWVVRDVPERTRRRVKSFAADRGMTMAAALEKLVDDGLTVNKIEVTNVNMDPEYLEGMIAYMTRLLEGARRNQQEEE